ncbi:kinetochore-associated protein NSL1 homolog [Phyllobates terribilis]|uniref:kinetochore-associated protein NSL1 homolog n=1 Tax=Phyllobates terribilis TaxID=111132 RepID=UPI003CCADE7F
MAANVDSPNRRSLRLQGQSHETVTPDSRGPKGPSNGRRTSSPRTRLSGGKLNDSESLRRSKGQKVEDLANNSSAGAKGNPSAGSTEVWTSGEDRGRSSDDKSHKKTVKTRRSGEDGPDDGRLERKDGGAAPAVAKQERNDAGEAGCCRESEEKGKKTEDLTHEVRASCSPIKMTKGEKLGPAMDRIRTDVEVAGPSGVDSLASKESARSSRGNDNANASRSPSTRPLCATKSPDQGTSATAPLRDSRVRCASKHLLQEMLGMCTEFSKEILQSQNYLNPEQKQQEHRNFILNLETTFQDNVSINGQSWDEAVDSETESVIRILEDQLDDTIVETAYKRKRYPQKILHQLVKALKVEREILNGLKLVVEPTELKLDPNSESRMTEQTTTTASISQQIKETMKALPAHLEKAEGFSQVLNLQPVLQKSRLRQDIFSSRVVLQDLQKTLPKELETTPRENERAANIVPTRSSKRLLSSATRSDLYPLRPKRKISLEGVQMYVIEKCEEEKKTEWPPREAAKNRHRKRTSYTRNMNVWSKKTLH